MELIQSINSPAISQTGLRTKIVGYKNGSSPPHQSWYYSFFSPICGRKKLNTTHDIIVDEIQVGEPGVPRTNDQEKLR